MAEIYLNLGFNISDSDIYELSVIYAWVIPLFFFEVCIQYCTVVPFQGTGQTGYIFGLMDCEKSAWKPWKWTSWNLNPRTLRIVHIRALVPFFSPSIFRLNDSKNKHSLNMRIFRPFLFQCFFLVCLAHIEKVWYPCLGKNYTVQDILWLCPFRHTSLYEVKSFSNWDNRLSIPYLICIIIIYFQKHFFVYLLDRLFSKTPSLLFSGWIFWHL